VGPPTVFRVNKYAPRVKGKGKKGGGAAERAKDERGRASERSERAEEKNSKEESGAEQREDQFSHSHLKPLSACKRLAAGFNTATTAHIIIMAAAQSQYHHWQTGQLRTCRAPFINFVCSPLRNPRQWVQRFALPTFCRFSGMCCTIAAVLDVAWQRRLAASLAVAAARACAAAESYTVTAAGGSLPC
jgi:hypothetical protein